MCEDFEEENYENTEAVVIRLLKDLISSSKITPYEILVYMDEEILHNFGLVE